ncbi:methylated-DNA--[protein]-cysteine S-methyltransferase [Glaciihabitans sp. UYNi722]|uniref:methylated-DNA--[protein]-cysteine S-methyltransferase n=1 Tax=Glaciihabitans sp. UYNi722 TaxID=3156344 RepID=UPI0033967E7A
MYTRHAILDTTLGDLTVVAADDAIVGLYFPRHWYLPPEGSIGEKVDARDDPLLERSWLQLKEYLSGERTSFDLPIALNGNPFQQQVWTILNEIPFGETTTYGEIAARLGDRNVAQLVGQAVGHNPISIIVPCHRVVGKDGKLTGYAGGLERKQTLLELEEPELRKAEKLF